jgi:hypothetical protein
MKVQKLGIEWGAAFEEARPIRISHYGREIVVFVNENHDLVVELPAGAKLSIGFTKAFESNGAPCFTAVVQ